MRPLLAALLCAGCTVTANFDHAGRVTDVTLAPGFAAPAALDRGRQRITGVGLAYTGDAAVVGYYSVDTARLGPCGAIIITDHPERVDPALVRPC